MFNFSNSRARSQHFKIFVFNNQTDKNNIIDDFLNSLLELNKYFRFRLQRISQSNVLKSSNADDISHEFIFRNSAIVNQSIEHIKFMNENFDMNSANESNIHISFTDNHVNVNQSKILKFSSFYFSSSQIISS